MRKYIIVNEDSGEVTQTMQWGDDRDFPVDYPINDGEKVIPVDESEAVETFDVYDSKTEQFYVLDITDNELEISNIKNQLAILEIELSLFQEDTWTAMGIDETKLPQIWQDRLTNKRALRTKLAQLLA